MDFIFLPSILPACRCSSTSMSWSAFGILPSISVSQTSAWQGLRRSEVMAELALSGERPQAVPGSNRPRIDREIRHDIGI